MVKCPVDDGHSVVTERRIPASSPMDALYEAMDREELEAKAKGRERIYKADLETKRTILHKLIPQFAEENGLECSGNRGNIDHINVKFLWDYLSFKRWIYVEVANRSLDITDKLRISVYGGLARNGDMWFPYCVVTNEDQFGKWFPYSGFEISLSGILWKHRLERRFKRELQKIYNLVNKINEQSPLTENEIGRSYIS